MHDAIQDNSGPNHDLSCEKPSRQLPSIPPKARVQARKIIEAATEGRDIRNERREQNITRHTNTFLAVRKRFIELEMKPNVKNWKTVESTLRLHVEPHWEGRPVLDIRRSEVHELLDDLVADDKTAIAREVRKHLSRFFNWCVDREIIKDSPIHGKVISIQPASTSKPTTTEPSSAVFEAVIEIDKPPIDMQPGMAGYGKIDVGWNPLGYILVRPVIRFCQVEVWSWLP